MTNTGNSFQQTFWKPVLIGAAIALALMTLFVSGVDNPNPEWGKYWMIRPLAVIAFAGATGGFIIHYLSNLKLSGWQKALAMIAGFLIYIIGLWMGSVLGLVGTLWD